MIYIKQLKEERSKQKQEEMSLLNEIEAMTGNAFMEKAKQHLRGVMIEKGMEYYLESLQRLEFLAEEGLQRSYPDEIILLSGTDINLQKEITYVKKRKAKNWGVYL